MARPQPADPVKLFVAILWSDAGSLGSSLTALAEQWGEIDFIGPDHPFDLTGYYEAEMGRGLQRRLISFSRLVPPDILSEAKLRCNEIEDRLSGAGGRPVNLDIGYLDHNKIVLGSLKQAGQKIYLRDGVYADLVGRYRSGRYQPFEWTFPDFRDGRYDAEFSAMRRIYLERLRARRGRPDTRLSV